MGTAVVHGWGKVTVVGTSLGVLVTSKMPRRKPVAKEDRVTAESSIEPEETVKRVVTPPEEGVAGSANTSVSEAFHAETDIIEAEPVVEESSFPALAGRKTETDEQISGYHS